jgi:hypothetical protein
MTTPDLRERVARAIEESLYGTECIGRTDTLQYGLEADAAINIMRPFIRDEVLEEAAKRVAKLPMIVGIPGLPYERHRNSFEYAAAIRALKEKP